MNLNIITDFRASAREFKNLASVTIIAMLLALHTVLATFVSVQVTESMRISVSFTATCATAYLFGPVVGLVFGTLGDLIQFIIKPTGGYFFGWTLNAALAGLIYGIGFYHRSPRHPQRHITGKGSGIQPRSSDPGSSPGSTFTRAKCFFKYAFDLRYLLRTIVVMAAVALLVNALLGTYWCMIMYGKHFAVYFYPRLIKNLVQLPINTALAYLLIQALSSLPLPSRR